MRQIEYILLLRNAFITQGNHEEIKITSTELSKILSTSGRNTNYLIKKLKTQNYLNWIPGKGRGNQSTLIFYLSFSEIANLYVKAMIKENRVIDIIDFAHSFLSDFGLHEIYTLLHQSLGAHIEKIDSEYISTIKLLIPQEIKTLDPKNVTLYFEAHLISQIYNTLVLFDEMENKLTPSLAYDWKEQEKGKKWTFLLRKSVQFHNGDLFTSKDVVFTFNRLLNSPHSSIFSLLKDIREIEMVGDHIIIFHLKKANYFFPRILSSFQCSILHHNFPNKEDINGTGSFFIKEHSEQFIRLTAFQAYFQERALIDQLDIWMDSFSQQIPNKMTELLTPSIHSQKASITHHQQLLGSRFLIFNSMKHGPSSDPNLRMAITQMVNTTKMIEELGGNRISVAKSFLPEISKTSSIIIPSIESAKNYLKKSHYQGEVINLYYFHLNEGFETATWIKKQAMKIGLSISLKPISSEVIANQHLQLDADILLYSSILSKDIELSLYTLFKSENSFIRPYLTKESCQSIDDKLEKFSQSEDSAERNQTLLQIEKFLKDQFSILFLYHSTNTLNYKSHVRGMQVNSFGLIDFRKIWIEPDSLIVK
ncbi:ABC transporter substrate-binding protein [Metabacillus litoralis]|uniref:ABC transporter substrate-binding protein n=1 Tax=Metabacillus litoralis TaxID=152268 RepID=UPI001CFD855B|nr:ABC transporter substrate-binding protein [Metabacillus litoralis]